MTDEHDCHSAVPFHDAFRAPSAPIATAAETRDEAADPAEAPALARTLAVHLDETRSKAFDLALLWQRLCLGTWRVFDTFVTEERCYLVLEAPSDSKRSGTGSAKLRILERVLLGESAKVVSFDLRVSPSTVTIALKSCLQAMGLYCRLSGVPLLLVMAAHAPRENASSTRNVRIAHFRQHAGTRWVVSTPRPDSSLSGRLSSAELVVVRELLHGKSHAQISRLRGTSMRTVANQLATAFHKLGVSGRSELVHQLVRQALNTPRSYPRGQGTRAALSA